MNPHKISRTRKAGTTYVATMILFSGIAVAGVSYVSSSTSAIKISRRRATDLQITQLCEAGVQSCLRGLWREFKSSQTFANFDSVTANVSISSPGGIVTGTIPGVGRFTGGVTWKQAPEGDTYSRYANIRGVGWIDSDNDAVLDSNESVKIIDVKAHFKLERSKVFDYVYFINNYGWMKGFQPDMLYLNGDIRANGNFSFTNGSPTVNGSVVATDNDKIDGSPEGLVSGVPVKMTNADYATSMGVDADGEGDEDSGGDDDNQDRWRPAYNAARHGARGSDTYKTWKDIIFDADASVQDDSVEGAAIFESTGSKSWTRTSAGATGTTTLIDTSPSHEVVMPDLSSITTYQTLSQNYVNGKTTFKNGSANPNSNNGAWLEVYNSSTRRYQRLTTNGVVSGSVIAIGSSSNPIRIHGPVTVTQDVVIKGTVSGQGTIYSGRNIHIVGPIIYKNKPDFKGGNPTAIDASNEQRDILGLAARGAVLGGNPNSYTSTNMYYLTPPFTKSRTDEQGNTIPAFNAYDIDASGRMRYQSVISDNTMNSIAEAVTQIDAIVYTNSMVGGNFGASGRTFLQNGSLIGRDDAMVVYSYYSRSNYDSRVKERSIDKKPLVDIVLPRATKLTVAAWQDRGISFGL